MWRSDAFPRRGLDRAAVAAAILPSDILLPALRLLLLLHLNFASGNVCAWARWRGVRARSSRPPISAYLISYFLTYSRSSRVSGNGERSPARCAGWRGDATTHNARADYPGRTSTLRPCHNGTRNARHSAPECGELNAPRPRVDFYACKPLASYDLLRDHRDHCRINFVR